MVRRLARPTLAVLLLAACAAPRLGGGDELAPQLAGRAAGQPRSCLPTTGGAGLTIVAPGVFAHRGGDVLWINRLAPACSGIRSTDTLIFEPHGGQHCRGDPVRALERGRSIPGPACILGDFVPYRRSG